LAEAHQAAKQPRAEQCRNALAANALQKATFHAAKGGLSRRKTRPFGRQKAANHTDTANRMARKTRKTGMKNSFFGVLFVY